MPALRYALRSLAKSPGFATIAVLALGIGLGLSTTMFAVLDAVIHPYMAYRQPENLFGVNWWFGRKQPLRPLEVYRFLRDNTTSFEAVVPVSRDTPRFAYEGRDYPVWMVTPAWFGLMGVTPERGRPFVASDGDDVALVSRELWRRLHGGRRDLNGATLTYQNRSYSIIGVLPRGTEVSVLIAAPPNIETTNVSLFARPTVRLRAGVTREQAAEELKSLARSLTERFNAREAPFAFELYPVVDQREEVRDLHKAMLGSSLAVLLIACVNLAHLMLARGLAKRREFALRMALGASRGVVIRQMFAECAIMTAGGAVVGALVALWGTDVLTNRMPQEVSWVGLVRPQLSWRVFAAAAAAAALSALLFGLLPAIRVASSVNLDDPLKDDTGTTTGRVRFRYNPLVMVEVALALVLMMGGGVLLRTVSSLERGMADANTRTLLRAFAFGRTMPAVEPGGRPRQVVIRAEDVTSGIGSIPGVVELAMIGGRQVAGGAISAERDDDSVRTITSRSILAVSPSYLRVMRLPILKGRDFEPGDGHGHGTAILSALAAERLYPKQNPIGRMLKLGAPTTSAPWVTIVGVSRTEQEIEGEQFWAPNAAVYVAAEDSTFTGAMIIRTATADPGIVARVRVKLSEVPGVEGNYVGRWDENRLSNIASRGFLAKVFVSMGGVALGLAMLGLYGVLAYAVGRRMREFAVRIALGASPRGLLKMVLHDGFVMLLAGIGVGAFVALVTTRLLDAVLITILPSDVMSLVVCEAVMIITGLAAALAPARRASNANPMDILRAT